MKAIALVESQSNISRLTAGPTGIPADRLAALRDAYKAATTDPEFLKKAESLGLPIDPLRRRAGRYEQKHCQREHSGELRHQFLPMYDATPSVLVRARTRLPRVNHIWGT